MQHLLRSLKNSFMTVLLVTAGLVIVFGPPALILYLNALEPAWYQWLLFVLGGVWWYLFWFDLLQTTPRRKAG